MIYTVSAGFPPGLIGERIASWDPEPMMIEINRILCPTDFSEFSQHALEQAVALARWYGSRVTALHVFPVPITMPAVAVDASAIAMTRTTLTSAARIELELELARFVAPVQTAAVAIETAVVEGDIVAAILEAAERLPADLVVMGTHGRAGFERLLLGSATERVLRKAPCPVLTVPRRTAATRLTFKRILCAVDFSSSSLRALTHALSLAQETDAQLIVLHVVELLPEGHAREYLSEPPTLRMQLQAAAEEQLAAAIPGSARTFCAIEEVIETGRPYKQILRLAAARDVDLIVVGVHGRGVADLMLFGSTTQQIVRMAACPVLTLRHDLAGGRRGSPPLPKPEGTSWR